MTQATISPGVARHRLQRKRRRGRLVRLAWAAAITAGVGGLLYFLLPGLSRGVADWFWFAEVGYSQIFLKRIVSRWGLGILGAGATFAFLYLNIRLVRKSDVEVGEDGTTRRRHGPKPNWGHRGFLLRVADLFAGPLSVIVALGFGIAASTSWALLLQHLNREPFGTVDPVFGRDVGYYVFTYPVIANLMELLLWLVAAALGLVVTLYAHRRRYSKKGWRISVHPVAARHIGLLAALAAVVIAAWLHFVRVPALLFATNGPIVGARYTDLHMLLPAFRLLTITALAVAPLLVWITFRGRIGRALSIASAIAMPVYVLTFTAIPEVFQRLVVVPNELEREAPQIAEHLAATKAAWGLSAVVQRDLRPEQPLTLADLERNAATIRNVNLWNRELLLQTFAQLQAIRTYYDFISVAEDRYVIDGEYRQVHLAARELNVSLLPIRGFINEHLTYTHGFGLALGPSNETTSEGLPLLFIKDLPPVSSAGPTITRPEIYYGQLANEYVLVTADAGGTVRDEAQGTSVARAYTGAGGVEVDALLRRVLFAVKFRSLNILLARGIGEDTRILYYRNVRERAQRVLPSLRLDRDPYLVVTDDGRLKWILDAYTTTKWYPYAQRLPDGTSYLRNSVKVVIDAYDGAIDAYLADPTDPLIRTFDATFPGVLKPLDAMPAGLRAHIRYPEDLFRAQAALYAIYHLDDPTLFYHREDQWEIPVRPGQERASYYMQRMVMRLPGESGAEFVAMTPFTPRHKDNLAAWLVARSDGANYGELVAYRFQRESLVYGPKQVMNRINQDTEISRLVALWDQRGSEAIWGDLLVIPVEQSLIYVQPLYLRARGGRIPELKRVVLAYENRVAMAESLPQSIAAVFGGGQSGLRVRDDMPSTPESAINPAVAELIRQAAEHQTAARAAQRADDWAGYGRHMEALTEALKRLQEMVKDST
jgi:uncharacterized protein